MSGKYDDLEKLRDLYSKGIISEAEFNAEKAKILNDNREAGLNATTGTADNNNGYCSLMHLSQFSNFLFQTNFIAQFLIVGFVYFLLEKLNFLKD